jgi:hypothetical protein
MKTLLVVSPKKFEAQRGTVATALQEIDLDNPESLEIFISRMVDLGVLGIIGIA